MLKNNVRIFILFNVIYLLGGGITVARIWIEKGEVSAEHFLVFSPILLSFFLLIVVWLRSGVGELLRSGVKKKIVINDDKIEGMLLCVALVFIFVFWLIAIIGYNIRAI